MQPIDPSGARPREATKSHQLFDQKKRAVETRPFGREAGILAAKSSA
jgi:hypothetical protein